MSLVLCTLTLITYCTGLLTNNTSPWSDIQTEHHSITSVENSYSYGLALTFCIQYLTFVTTTPEVAPHQCLYEKSIHIFVQCVALDPVHNSIIKLKEVVFTVTQIIFRALFGSRGQISTSSDRMRLMSGQ